MDANRLQRRRYGARIAAIGVTTGLLGGCLQTAPVVVTPQDQQSRVVYNCPNAKSIDVTKLSNGASAIVVVDGQTLQLNRDGTSTSGERYSNRIQTLTLYGGSATFETLGRTRYGPCTAGEDGAPGADAREFNRRTKQENTD
jgi:membrane-bound inhibitor of C-type lysozyme